MQRLCMLPRVFHRTRAKQVAVRAAVPVRSGKRAWIGKATYQHSEALAPDVLGGRIREGSAEFERGEPFTDGVEVERGVIDCVAA